jgi:UDP-N-acetylglucosamine 2-epimerase (non-hydrolysing)
MPEEINRVVTDVLSDLLFVTEQAGVTNLLREGIPQERIFLVGDLMIDSVARALPRALEASAPVRATLPPGHYAMLTLHRPVNVDSPEQLAAIVSELEHLPREVMLLFPIHPRTEARLKSSGLLSRLQALPNLRLFPPMGYLEFLGLLSQARFVLTDSGGIQSEAAYLRVPCLTLRDTTERPETVDIGANRLLGNDPAAIGSAVYELLNDVRDAPPPSALMDGHAAERIVSILHQFLDPISPR